MIWPSVHIGIILPKVNIFFLKTKITRNIQLSTVSFSFKTTIFYRKAKLKWRTDVKKKMGKKDVCFHWHVYAFLLVYFVSHLCQLPRHCRIFQRFWQIYRILCHFSRCTPMCLAIYLKEIDRIWTHFVLKSQQNVNFANDKSRNRLQNGTPICNTVFMNQKMNI